MVTIKFMDIKREKDLRRYNESKKTRGCFENYLSRQLLAFIYLCYIFQYFTS
jgi:hypothetical protein